jgi:hypothetical protein
MSSISKGSIPSRSIKRFKLKAMEENLQHALDDAIARGVLTTPLNSAISRIIAHLRARQQTLAI